MAWHGIVGEVGLDWTGCGGVNGMFASTWLDTTAEEDDEIGWDGVIGWMGGLGFCIVYAEAVEGWKRGTALYFA